MDNAKQFTARIYKAGINPCVDVPAEVSSALGGRGYIPVRGALNGRAFRANLVPVKNAPHRLYINAEMRRGAGVDAGQDVLIKLERDDAPRTLPVPPAFARALEANPEAKAAFASLPPSHRKEYLDYLNSLKKPETLAKNIEKVIAGLLKK